MSLCCLVTLRKNEIALTLKLVKIIAD